MRLDYKRMKYIRPIATIAAALALIAPLSACGGQAVDANGSESTIITVGENTKNNRPYNYVNENGQIDGYEAALLKKIDEKLPQYTFHYKQMDWANTLVSLDSGKTDIAASSLSLSSERKQKYAHAETPDAIVNQRLVVAKNNNTLKSVDDLGNKRVIVWQGTDVNTYLEDWNKKHPDNPAKLQLGDWSWEQAVASVDNGTADAMILDDAFTKMLRDTYGDKIKSVGKPVITDSTYLLINKTKPQLAKDINGALTALPKDGTLDNLSQKYLGHKYDSKE